MGSSEVRVVVRKFDGSLHWNHRMRRLGEDEHGMWLGAPAGTTHYRGETPIYDTTEPRVKLIPPDAWWTAWFCAAPAACEIYCDVITPSVWPNPAEVTMIDLDLDVWRSRLTGAVELLDEDEFATHQKRYGYPPHVIRQAEETAGWLISAVRNRAEPFGDIYQAWLARV